MSHNNLHLYANLLSIQLAHSAHSAIQNGRHSSERLPLRLHMEFVQGVDLTDEELIGYISESCTMSKALEEYEGAPAMPAFNFLLLIIMVMQRHESCTGGSSIRDAALLSPQIYRTACACLISGQCLQSAWQ